MMDGDLKSLREMWPRPRVGQHVKLKNGKVAQIVTVRKARDVLNTKTEVEAMLMGPTCKAIFGSEWLDIYYEASVILPGENDVRWVTPTDVESIVDET